MQRIVDVAKQSGDVNLSAQGNANV